MYSFRKYRAFLYIFRFLFQKNRLAKQVKYFREGFKKESKDSRFEFVFFLKIYEKKIQCAIYYLGSIFGDFFFP